MLLSMNETTGLYIHIPFCIRKCAYCDFNSYAGEQSLFGPYLRALRREMALYASIDHPGPGHGNAPAAAGGVCQTLYVGGGTPTVLPADDLCALVRDAEAMFGLPGDAEITVEANPGTVDEAALRALAAAGVNRLSLGVQSLDPHMLRILGRIHDADQARRAVFDARAAGIENLNLDLIFGLPGQGLSVWQEDLEGILALEPDHLSLYALTVEEGTPLAASIGTGALPSPDPDLAAEMYEWAEERLARDGWDHYEISNWARPGYACRHNLIYWRNEPYLGLGAGAHSSFPGMERAGLAIQDERHRRSSMPGNGHCERSDTCAAPRPRCRRAVSTAVSRSRTTWQRWANLPKPRDYIAALEQGQRPIDGEVEGIDCALERAETMIMGLRLLHEGVPAERFRRRFGISLEEAYEQQIEGLVARGLLERLPDRLRLTAKGHLLGNQVFVEFL